MFGFVPLPSTLKSLSPADNTIYFDHANLITPSTLQEIVAAVKSANDKGRRLRVLGSGHSWSPVATSSDIMLSLVNYGGVVALDKQALTVTVKGGTRLSQVNAALSEQGFALSILPSVSSQTVAGAIATGAVRVCVCVCVCTRMCCQTCALNDCTMNIQTMHA